MFVTFFNVALWLLAAGLFFVCFALLVTLLLYLLGSALYYNYLFGND